MKKGFSLGLFLVLDLTILLTSFFFFSLLEGKGKIAKGKVPSASVQANYAGSQESPTFESAAIVAEDARSILIDTFLAKYHSPMGEIGSAVVTTADRYGLPFWLVPAIAQCESNLGKHIPEGSNNAWGWGVYGDKITQFTSWQQGVEKVSAGLSQNYLNKGFSSPEEIMKKYTPSSNGSWATCINEFLNELK